MLDRRHASSDGGAVRLKAAEPYQVGGAVSPGVGGPAGSSEDPAHATALLGQRIFGIACERAMATTPTTSPTPGPQAARWGGDPVAGEASPSSADRSRGSRTAKGRSALYELAVELAMRVIERASAPAGLGGRERITLDLRPDRRRDARRPAAHLLPGITIAGATSPLLAFLILRQGTRTVSVRGGAAARKSCRTRGTAASSAAAPAAAGLAKARFLVRLDGGLRRRRSCSGMDAEPRLDYVVAMAGAVSRRHAPALIVAQAPRWRGPRRVDYVPGRYVGPRAPRRDQGRGRPARRPRAARQPACSS